MLLDPIDEDNSLAQGGTYIGFVICHLVEVPKDVVALNFFKFFQLGYNLLVVVSQAHVVRGLIQIESLDNDSRIPYDNRFLDGKSSVLNLSLPDG